MEIKLVIASRLSYYFCGSISLSILNNVENPLVVNLDSLTKQEVLGLSKAVKTGVIMVLSGEDALTEKAESYKSKKANILSASNVEQEVPVETSSDVVVKDVTESVTVSSDIETEKSTVPIEEETTVEEVPVKTTIRKRSTTTKK